MIMLCSSEIRWFFKGQTSNEILLWFKSKYDVKDDKGEPVNTLEPELSRDDCYLLFPECDSVGVKLREDKKANKVNFEIKALLSPARPLTLANNISGKTDQWVKWSVTSTELSKIFEGGSSAERWIKVNKTRYLRKFATENNVKEVWAETKPREGCNIELTNIKVNAGSQEDWFSIGFEAFGPPANIHLTLVKTANFFFNKMGNIPDLELDAFHSLSYPSWFHAI